MIEKEKIPLSEERGFYYADFGSETHGRTSFRLWVNRKLVKRDEQGNPYIEFPIRATIHRTEKGTLVLRPSQNSVVFDVFIRCGYRGGSNIEVKSDIRNIVPYSIYRSPRGSLGISDGALIEADVSKLPVVIEWHRSGRTYGGPREGVLFLYEDKIEQIDSVTYEEWQELQKELDGEERKED